MNLYHFSFEKGEILRTPKFYLSDGPQTISNGSGKSQDSFFL
jgi:hypothetical protein